MALAWTGELLCGTGGAGINCQTVVGVNPAGGSGCDINMGTMSSASWPHFYTSEANSDAYLYICNGTQHSSLQNMNHRFRFRERTTVPLPICDIQMTQSTYSAGQTVTASVFRFANPGAGAVAVEIKAWLSGPAGVPFSLINTGADGSVSLPASLDVDAGPVPLFTVSASFPVGSYELSGRILDPITGAVVTQDLNPFVIE